MKLAFTMQTTREINMCNKYAPGTESSILKGNLTYDYLNKLIGLVLDLFKLSVITELQRSLRSAELLNGFILIKF